MLLIYNSNGKLENVKAEVGHTAERHSLLELESLHCRCPKCPKGRLFSLKELRKLGLESLSDFKIEFRWKMIH